MDLWTNASGEIIVDGSGNPIECDTCPCGVPPCCIAGDLPDSIGVFYNINDIFSEAESLDRVGNGYVSPSGFVLCDFGDGHNQLRLDVSITCSGSTWHVDIGYVQYTWIDGIGIGDPILGNFMSWNYNYNVGTTYSDFFVQCNPFQVYFKNNNTNGNNANGSILTCDGTPFPFTMGADSVFFELSAGEV